ncbi:MAG: transglutaminase family protein [Hyphomonadaceae bacterium]|nr:transglutaminase family protein [Hyphomonadaceae bacterium]
MPAFQLRHSTTYAFSSPVTLQPHQLYLRPRGDHKLKLNASTLTLSPPAEVVWRSDLYGNSVAIAHFAGTTTRLDIISELSVETFPRSESQRRLLLESGTTEYSPTERRMLAPYINQSWETGHAAAEWIRGGATKVKKRQYERLLECAARIRYEFDYRIRYEQGLQTPDETLRLHSGTCRDFAELMIAAARSLDCAARFVTGYVFTPNAAPGSSSPHAWAEVYIPAVGWIELDATNGLVDDGDLIPIASAATGAELTPISGAFTGFGATSSLSVGVDVFKQA